ncbi:daxx-like protein [Bradysia coprophila]|uniref:daxx-like protein n=1 Tax=Bradysia coprophila TaxID=38358 RepID=UPI00187DA8CA|nr:daxx-like protein [Bradysia coprophila]
MKPIVISLLDSDDEEDTEVTKSSAPPPKVNKTVELTRAVKRPAENDSNVSVKRIKPTLVSSNISKEPKNNEDIDEDGFTEHGHNNNVNANKNDDEPSSTTIENPITESFAKLINVCRQADSSRDMEQLINKKLLRYYHMVHPDFINSKSFGKVVTATTVDIQSDPKFVYAKLSNVLEELNIRRKSGQTVITNEGVGSTGDARRDNQIKRLNKALYVLKKKIAKLEASEVDLTDESNSLYILTEKYKKRACEIYEKICDITGESKHAHRQVKKPITFNGTKYPQFNKTMQAFVNKTGSFPDLFDVRRILDHCNEQHSLKLGREEIKAISQDAFIRIGKLLQKRRKTDLYETVSFFSEGSAKDPAGEDADLKAKLDDNRKHHNRINELINKYAEFQDKASDISIPLNSSNVNPSESNNKENQVENNAEVIGLDDDDDDSVVEDELDAEEAEQTGIEPQIDIVISDDEELS